MAETGVKTRQSNMELLRVVAMLMIITLHYLDKGNVLPEFAQMSTINHYLVWLLEAFCYVAVNVYALISGYFLTTSKFTFKKLFTLWLQIVFYSWLIGGIFLLTGMVAPEQINSYEIIFIALPVTSGHYWFATIYVLLFAVSPFLNAAVSKMNQKQHRICIYVLIAVFSAWNTLLPMTMPLADGEGMDIAWFVTLYVIAAYLRKYPADFKHKGFVYGLGYAVFCVMVFLLGIGVLFFDSVTGKLGGYATNCYAYNSLPILFASICLFIAFTKMEIKGKYISKAINLFAGATFGIYLIHEHRYIRYLWQQWLCVEQNATQPWMIIHLLGSVILIFLVSAVIEMARKWLFKFLTERSFFAKFFAKFSKIESKMNGEAS